MGLRTDTGVNRAVTWAYVSGASLGTLHRVKDILGHVYTGADALVVIERALGVIEEAKTELMELLGKIDSPEGSKE